MARTRLVGFIPFGRRLLHQQRREQEILARVETAPRGNVRTKTAGASPVATARRDKESGLA